MRAKVLKFLVSIFLIGFILFPVNMVHADALLTIVRVGAAPWGVAYDSAKGEIFVVNSGTGTVSVLSDSDFTILATVPVGQQPYRDIYDSGRGEIFVANYGDNSVSVISDVTNTVVATVPVGLSPSSFAYDSGKGEIFVANSGGNTVSVISDSTNAVVATVTVGSNPYDLDYDSGKGEIFVANSFSRSVSIISDINNQVVATVPVGSGPLGVAYDSAKGEVFVANSVSNTVSVISDSTNTVIATVNVGTSPGPMVYDSKTGEIFAVNRGSGSVSVISDSTNAVVTTLTVGAKPYGAAYDSGRGEIFVTNYGDGTLSVMSDSSNTSTLPGTNATSDLLQQVWVPEPTNTVVAVGLSAVVVGAVSLLFSAISDPLGGFGGALSEKIKDVIPDEMREWLEEVVSSRRELEAADKTGSPFAPTRAEVLAYVTSIVVLAIAFSYVKIINLSQLWELLPLFFATSVIVGFVQHFFSIVYLRSKGVWSEYTIWPLGLFLFLFTTFSFRVPFSSPTRSIHSKKFTERLGAVASAAEILISIAFAGLFFLLLKGGYVAVGDAGLSMCVIGSFFGTFPVSPMSGKDIFDHSKRLWATLFSITLLIFVAWLLLI